MTTIVQTMNKSQCKINFFVLSTVLKSKNEMREKNEKMCWYIEWKMFTLWCWWRCEKKTRNKCNRKGFIIPIEKCFRQRGKKKLLRNIHSTIRRDSIFFLSFATVISLLFFIKYFSIQFEHWKWYTNRVFAFAFEHVVENCERIYSVDSILSRYFKHIYI